MKKTISFMGFQVAFVDMNRQDNFSYQGLLALFDYLENYEEDCDTEIELDVIALCCEYTEYENFEEYDKDYSDSNIMGIEDLQEHTIVIMIDDVSFIIQDY